MCSTRPLTRLTLIMRMWLQRHDILIPNTKATEGRYEVSSPIELKLCLSSDAKDTDFKATIRNSPHDTAMRF
jgi:hypothetical protein